MNIYFYDRWEKNIKCVEVLKETKCFYFLAESGPGYKTKIFKTDMGKIIFKTHNNAIDGYWEKKYTECEKARVAIRKLNTELQIIYEWCKDNKIDVVA